VLIYATTKRPFWNGYQSGGKFLLTSLVLGIPTALIVSLVAAHWNSDLTPHSIMRDYGQSLCRWLMVAVSAKFLVEASVLAWLGGRRFTPLKRTAMLLVGELSMTSLLRCFFGVIGGLLLPLVLLSHKSVVADASGYHPMFLVFTVALIVVLLTVGELIERFLFFAASVAPKMPGGPC
jgi:DMSO reductase anchor subunit